MRIPDFAFGTLGACLRNGEFAAGAIAESILANTAIEVKSRASEGPLDMNEATPSKSCIRPSVFFVTFQRSHEHVALASHDLVVKIGSAGSKRLFPFILEPAVGAKPADPAPQSGVDLTALRRAIRESNKVRLRYRADGGEKSGRVVSSVVLGYAEATCMLVAWCELRDGFRHFRTDRMITADTA